VARPKSATGTISDAALRDDRLVFYREDAEAIDRVLEEFLALSNARCTFLIDRDGHLITRKGESVSIHPDSLAALVAGSFAATREMARLLGEPEFRVLYHQGSRDNHIQIALVGNRTLLTILFDDRTTLGMVRFYATETARRLEEVFENAKNRQNPPDEEVRLGEAFTEAARDQLGDVLGG